MLDLEKVIKAIETCYTLGHNCTECPLFPEDDCNDKLMHDALSMLKEQRAVEPINSYGTFRCGNCRNIVGYNDDHGRGYQNNFCSFCGKAVRWE